MHREKQRQARSRQIKEYQTREEDGSYVISGYFSVFGSETELWPGAYEEVAKEAFDNTLSGDIRALINHDCAQVLGRTKNGTLTLRTDEHGLYGEIRINPKDQSAMDCYERVKRGDVDQCSFGFEIVKEDTEIRDDGSIKWTIREVNLYEVSICTFPAYEDTSVNARKKDLAEIKKREVQAFKTKMLKKLKGD
ncbi:HK97 family phage prohead protease [Dubosiella newyorkensis]|uniref:HK97 family phage prohead protease n=1 Tax=Dubosiella newyorkensis TaxID=1862672 RepID=UPI00272E6085|nr:HK97 family phage prohead protease [Dubosiella newyorkensis]